MFKCCKRVNIPSATLQFQENILLKTDRWIHACKWTLFSDWIQNSFIQRKTKMLFHRLIHNRPHPSFVWQKVWLTNKSRKALQGSKRFSHYRHKRIFQTYFYGINIQKHISLNQFFNSEFFSWGICLLTSWVCTIGIWSMLMQLNLIGQIY